MYPADSRTTNKHGKPYVALNDHLTPPPFLDSPKSMYPSVVQNGLKLNVYYLTIPRKPPSQNDFATRFDGRGKWKYFNAKRLWMKELPPPTAFGHVARGTREIAALRLLGKGERPFDTANLTGGLKPVVDALVLRGWLVDDRPGLMVDLGSFQIPGPWRGVTGPALIIRLADVRTPPKGPKQ